ncbi:MAG: HAD hydrolase-like protein, partial [Pseudomonadota bacterium]|nr:HAD hydrolase-like protein [Pseudomonadota bacterium]
MRTVIFDLDGTLADTSADLIAAANHCFIEMGVGPQLDAVGDAETAFHGARAMLRLGLSRMGDVDEAVIDRWYPVLLDAYDDNISVHTSLYPGAIEAVESLKSDGFAVGICTNKPSGLAEKLLNDLKIRDIFGSMIGA